MFVDVTLQEGYRLGGRVVFEGAPAPQFEELQGAPILVEGAEASFRDVRGAYLSASTFTSVQLAPGRFFVRPFPPEGWHLKSVTAGGQLALDAAIEVRDRDRQDVVITFSERPARVEGIVELDPGPAPERPTVYIFPAERELWQRIAEEPVRVARMVTGSAGTFTAELPPGSYYVAATSDAVSLPADFAALSASAELLRLLDGTTVPARRVRPVKVRR